MTSRERFLAVMDFAPGVQTLKAEYGYWTTAIKRFVREGLPVVETLPKTLPDNGTITGAEKVDPAGSEIPDRNVRAACGLDPYPAKFPFNMSPLLPEKTLEESEEYRVFTDRYGITMKVYKKGSSAPLDLDFPIKNRRDFERYKELYDRDFRKRLPRDWDRLKSELRNREYAIRLGGFPYGFFGFPRHLIGTTQVLLMMYDDPGLIKEINDFFLDFAMEYWAVIIRDIDPDCVLIWEDMAGKTGSMISKEMFAEFLEPWYVRMIDFLHRLGVRNIHVDSDGYVEELLPLWVRLGVTGIFPLEIQAGNDPLRVRSRFPRLQILGAIDKRVFTARHSTADVDQELTKVPGLLAQGGFVPHADHHVPDDSCWENFAYYRGKLNRLIEQSAPR
jgi:hypothetical protein